MRTKNLRVRWTFALVLSAASVAIGCGSDATPPATTDAGTTADAASDAKADASPPIDADIDAAPADATAKLTISPLAPAAKGCSTDTVLFTASGGTPPYTWSTSEGGTTNLTVKNATQAEWTDGADNFCGVANSGMVTITVTDSLNATASAVITVTGG